MAKKNKINSKVQKNGKESLTDNKAHTDSRDEDQSGYDSMIDNGTDEQSSSDDGFSEQEDAKGNADNTNLAHNQNLQKKRKQNLKQETTTPTEIGVAAKKQKTIEKVKAPTLEEINELKETRNLFHSNLFRLQVKEMLTELKIKEKYSKYVSYWLEKFSAFLKQLKSETTKQVVNEEHWLYKECSLQLPLALSKLRTRNQSPFQFQFIKPNEMPYLIGAAATNTLLGPKLIVDIVVSMPAECFQKDNYLNLIYEQKRACYLTYLAMKMLDANFLEGLKTEHLNFNYYANNPLKPILELSLPTSAATASIAKKLSIRIFVVADETSFKLSRFVPWNNNIRSSLFDEVDETTLPVATPNYNAGVLFDLTMKRNQDLLQKIFGVHKNLREGLILLKIWLKQRQLNVGFSGFHNHILAMFIAYLSKLRKLHTNMSSYQVARTVWNNLAHSAWDENLKGISLCAPVDTDAANQPTLEQFHVYYDVVFIDRTGFYNICANLSPEIYRRVRDESKLAINTLNDMKLNSFPLIFMEKYPLYSQFDHIIKIHKADIVEQILEIHATPSDRYNYAGVAHPQLLKIITTLLRKGLGQRINALIPIEQPSTAWSCEEQCSGLPEYIHLGLILQHENALEVLDKGPQSIDEGAREFRKFWGEKAELRRFQDGSITESVVWAANSDPLAKKRLVVRSIVLHLLKHHLQVECSDLEYLAGEFDVVFKLSPIFKTDKLKFKSPVDQQTDAEATSLNVIRAFDELGRNFNTLSELPLEIVSIAGISPVFRYCDPTPIIQQARCIEDKLHANSVQWGVIQLGLSGKWPEELAALRALKTAFYMQIAKLLHEKYHLRTKVTYNGVLVLKHGYVFGIEIAHQKEVVLLKRETTERGITKYTDSETSIAVEKRHYILPKVTGVLHGLYQTHPSFGGTVMIAKRWLYSQLIDDGLWPDECTELLIANQFLRIPQLVPLQPQTGFYRFLQLLAHTDWKTELFLINFNNEMNENEVCDLENRFNTERESFPPLCIVTSCDLKHYNSVWTSNLRPNINVLARVTILARQALAIIEPAIASTKEQFIKPSRLFTASHQGYDLVIRLKPELVPNSLAVEFASPFTKFSKPNFRLPLAGTNFLNDAVERLRESYSNYAAFFYNPCGGKEIGVIWKPNVFDEKEFKVNEVNGCTLSADRTKVQCKKEIFIEDFKVILKNFYLSIDTVDAILKESNESTSIWSQQLKLYKKPIVAKTIKLEDEQNSVIQEKVKELKKNITNKINTKKSKTKVVKSKLNKKVVVDTQKIRNKNCK